MSQNQKQHPVKKFDESLEELAIISILNSEENIQGYLLTELQDNLIFTKPFKEIFTRIKRLVKEKSKIPTKVEIYYDQTLSSENLLLLRESRYNEGFLSDIENATSLVESLRDYAKKRKFYEVYEDLYNYFLKEDSQTGLEDVANKAMKKIYDISTDISGTANSILKLDSDEAKNILDRILTEKDLTQYIPTGFKQFDQINKGLPRGGLTVIAATTGGGKSCCVNYMSQFMALAGFRVCVVSLEMNVQELMQRRIALLTGVTLTELKHQKFTEQQIQRYKKVYDSYVREYTEAGGCEDWQDKKKDLTIEELLHSLKYKNYDVIFIDYLGLLKGVGGDNQWQKLGDAARFCKIFAEGNNMNIIACAQLSKEGDVRYSQGILEHANNSFSWVYGKKEMENGGKIEVEQKKGRNSERFPFYLQLDFGTMSMKDLEGSDREAYLTMQRVQSQPQTFKSAKTGFYKAQ